MLVGFKKSQLDEGALLAQLPASQRAGVLIPYPENAKDSGNQCGVFFGVNTLLNHGRCYYEDGATPYLVTIEYTWKPQLV